jgi:hypothetical protein
MRLLVLVVAAISSIRAPLKPLAANSAVATSKMPAMVRAGSLVLVIFSAVAGVFIALTAIFLIAFLFAVLDALLITNLVVGFAVFTECTSSFIFAV